MNQKAFTIEAQLKMYYEQRACSLFYLFSTFPFQLFNSATAQHLHGYAYEPFQSIGRVKMYVL